MPNYLVSSRGKKFKVTMAAPPTESQVNEMLKAPPTDDTNLIEQLRPVFKQMESSGDYGKLHPRTKPNRRHPEGLQALGAYGVVPEFWFEKFPHLGLSLDSASKADYLKNTALQDEMFTNIIKEGIANKE